MWDINSSVNIAFYEGESEEALIGEYVRLRAAHPQFTPVEVTTHLFSRLKDPVARSISAARLWANDTEISKRIEVIQLGGTYAEELTKERLLQKMYNLTNNQKLKVEDIRVGLNGYMSVACLAGWDEMYNCYLDIINNAQAIAKDKNVPASDRVNAAEVARKARADYQAFHKQI